MSIMVCIKETNETVRLISKDRMMNSKIITSLKKKK